MNNRQLYIAWVRSKFPNHYMAALRKITRKPRSLGGLGDDLLLAGLGQDAAAMTDSTMVSGDVFSSFFPAADPGFSVVPTGSFLDPVMATIPAPSVSDAWVAPTNFQYTPSDSTPSAASSGSWFSGAGNLFSDFTKAVAGVAMTAIATKSSAQSQLLATNTQRANMGLPPVDANGVPIRSASLMPASGSLYALEQRLAGAGGISWVWLAGGAAALYLLFSGKRRR